MDIHNELKFSYLIEGFDNVPKKELEVLSQFISEEEPLKKSDLIKLDNLLNKNKNQKQRYHKKFGIYENGKLVYQPSLDKKEVERQIDEFIKIVNKNYFNYDIEIHWLLHILFEKIHPFVDGNGRIGRAILTKFLQVPISNFLYNNIKDYYKSLDDKKIMKGIIEYYNTQD